MVSRILVGMAKSSKTRLPASRYAKSEKLYADAQKLMPGGVSSPVRSFKSVGMAPVFIKEGKAARLTDVDNNVYIDYVLSYGPLIAGHCPQPVRAAVAKQIDKGSSYGCCSELEIRLATLIAAAMPNVPMVRFVNSGTEAAMSAIRLARAASGKKNRDVILKTAGGYHGHADTFLIEAGSGATTHGHPSSPGVPESVTHETAVAPFNDLEGAKEIFGKLGGRIAAMIVEPICGNMGVVPPLPGYLDGLKALCEQHGALLIFDEVMTGFRVAIGGAQGLYGVKPDLTCLGKIIGGGLPVGAYGGRVDLMNQVSPAGPVYQAGTLSGNPLTMAAGIAALSMLLEETPATPAAASATGGDTSAAPATAGRMNIYAQLEALSARLEAGLMDAAGQARVPIAVQRVGSMLTPFFLSAAQAAAHPTMPNSNASTGATALVIRNYADARQCDTTAYAQFFRGMLDRGIMLPPSQFEAWFLSSAHTEADVDQTIEAAREALRS